jgi:hypothetical protein
VEFTAKKSRNYRFTFEKCRHGAKGSRDGTDTLRLKTKMQNRNGLVQNLTNKALETNQIASCK